MTNQETHKYPRRRSEGDKGLGPQSISGRASGLKKTVPCPLLPRSAGFEPPLTPIQGGTASVPPPTSQGGARPSTCASPANPGRRCAGLMGNDHGSRVRRLHAAPHLHLGGRRSVWAATVGARTCNLRTPRKSGAAPAILIGGILSQVLGSLVPKRPRRVVLRERKTREYLDVPTRTSG